MIPAETAQAPGVCTQAQSQPSYKVFTEWTQCRCLSLCLIDFRTNLLVYFTVCVCLSSRQNVLLEIFRFLESRPPQSNRVVVFFLIFFI